MAVYKVLIVVVKIMNPKDYFYLTELLMLRKTMYDIYLSYLTVQMFQRLPIYTNGVWPGSTEFLRKVHLRQLIVTVLAAK